MLMKIRTCWSSHLAFDHFQRLHQLKYYNVNDVKTVQKSILPWKSFNVWFALSVLSASPTSFSSTALKTDCWLPAWDHEEVDVIPRQKQCSTLAGRKPHMSPGASTEIQMRGRDRENSVECSRVRESSSRSSWSRWWEKIRRSCCWTDPCKMA